MALVLGTNVGFVLTAPTADPAGTNTTIDGSSVIVKDTSPAQATKITEIGWYRGAGTNAANFEVALYSDLAGIAVTRLFVDNTNSSTTQGWITVSVDWAISGSTAYWLAVQMDAHSGTSSIDSATSGGSGTDILTSQTTLNDPYGGGTVADADGMYAIYAKVNVNQIVLPGVGALALAGFAASVLLPKLVLPGLGLIALTGFAPTWSSEAAGSSYNGTPGTGQVTLTGYAPTAIGLQNTYVYPGTGAISLTGFGPVVATPRNVQAGVGAVALNGFSPTVATPRNVSAGLGQITLSGFAPAAGSSVINLPGFGAVNLNGFSPSILTPRNINSGLGQISLNGFSPNISAGGNVNILPNTGQLSLIGYVPSVGDIFEITCNTNFDAPTINYAYTYRGLKLIRRRRYAKRVGASNVI